MSSGSQNTARTEANHAGADPESQGQRPHTANTKGANHKKVIRVVTVVAYVLSVSMAAICLSLYYLFIWDPRSDSHSLALTQPCYQCDTHTSGVPLSTTTNNGIKFAGEEAKDKLYEPKHKKRIVRVLTVIAYVFFVSLAAIMLSLYYVFLWSPQKVHIYRVIPLESTKCGSDKVEQIQIPVIQPSSHMVSKSSDSSYKMKLLETLERKEGVASKSISKSLKGLSAASIGSTAATKTNVNKNYTRITSTTVVK